ncbi:MAG: trehalase [Candidatus Eremiobacteraeota bacterium]|nr:trehalase [Candidatus Eremiobacteraeota bacterium]
MIHVETHFQALLQQEDTDGDRRITIHDKGPKTYDLDGQTIKGTYALSNLLQELALAKEAQQTHLQIDPQALYEPPTQRISKAIKNRCWDGLTRKIDHPGMLTDPKMPSEPRLYIPENDKLAQHYYKNFPAQIIQLPQIITPEYVQSLNDKPGLLSLAIEEEGPLPYVVPGGRFNEMYGWDSYFIALGLLHDEKIELAKAMLNHQVYQIRFYGKVLNANRSYYLTRSQPPFLTRFLKAILKYSRQPKAWIEEVLRTAMHEYAHVWTREPRLTRTGLSRYYGEGLGQPPETEPGHYDSIANPTQEYFTHDRTVRESGHDTSYRLEDRAAHLCTVDLNSLLYAYEVDLAELLDQYGEIPGYPNSEVWRARAQQRRQLLTQYCWDPAQGQFFDYDFVKQERTGYESATGLWPLWAGLATPQQAELAVQHATLEKGGLAAGSLKSRGPLNDQRPPRQWDYPYGWAPHQMMAWEGLQNCGLDPSGWAERWLRMMTKNAVDFNGVIPEKYDVVAASHEVFAEYGNVGADFDYITKEGFGWSNASYQIGLTYLSAAQRQGLDQLAVG